MCISYIAKLSCESVFCFAMKNSVCYAALPTVRSDMQTIFTKILQPSLGRFVAPVVGSQLGLACALPAALLYGEMMSAMLLKSIKAVKQAVEKLFFHVTPEKNGPIVRSVALSIVSFTTGFFAKTYFCNYAMPLVGSCFQTGCMVASPFFGASLPFALMIPLITPVVAPALTIFIGDILQTIVKDATYSFFTESASVLFDRNRALPQKIVSF